MEIYTCEAIRQNDSGRSDGGRVTLEKKGRRDMKISAPLSPVHNLFSSLAFSTKTSPHCGDGATEQASSQDLDYCAELITASALSGLQLELSSRQRAMSRTIRQNVSLEAQM